MAGKGEPIPSLIHRLPTGMWVISVPAARRTGDCVARAEQGCAAAPACLQVFVEQFSRLDIPNTIGPLGSGLNYVHQMKMAARTTVALKFLASLS
jgi:hypothetical protein